jgi:transcriptional regulator with PAS, ATPase and Fis domain
MILADLKPELKENSDREGFDRIFSPSAILNQDLVILYSNKSFDKLFKVSRDSNQKKICNDLSGLQLELDSNNKNFSPHKITLPGSNKGIDIIIEPLETLKNGERHYLVRLDSICRIDSILKSSNPFITQDDIRVERLLPQFHQLIGQNIRFKLGLVIAQRAALSNLPVLIYGESGTGKEILARAIHHSSPRGNAPLVDVNCAAIPDTLIETELFGYEKGAFTGASANGRTGYFAEANKGTIFLDEVSDASLQVQSKLLRVLEDGSFKRVGGSKNVKVDVRIISASNKDLTRLIAQNKFREDLFYRINAVMIFLPPLRERLDDLELLIEDFLKLLKDKQHLKISPSALQILRSYSWPGNVRELKGVVHYAAYMAQDSVIRPNSLPSFLFSDIPPDKERLLPMPFLSLIKNGTYNLLKVVDLFEKEIIKNVLEISSSRTEAIKTLGISRRSFYIKLKKFELT